MTRPTRFRPTILALAAVVTLVGCASAGKRLEQGMEAEAAGAFYAASLRYIEALEKDGELQEARDRLLEAGDSAIVIGVAQAREELDDGYAVAAGEEIRSLDALISRARSVGVRLPTSTDYGELRRAAFDAAIDELMAAAAAAEARSAWGEARSALERVVRDFEPSREQRLASEEAEATLLVAWAEDEEGRGRYRRAWDLAEEALSSGTSLAADVADRATDLQARAVTAGTRVLAVFPVTATAAVREASPADLAEHLSDLLELDHWRQPPLFVVVADPVLVRQATRRYNVPGARFRAEPVLNEVGADLGALIELTQVVAMEQDVRSRAREIRTRDGRTTNYTEESGNLTLTMEASIVILDQRGSQVASFTARASHTGGFERGCYRGDVGELDLSRGERRLFDPMIQRQILVDIETRAIEELADRVADRVFSQVLSVIP